MGVRIWHQSFTVLSKLGPYREAIEGRIRAVCRPDTEVVLHGMHPDTYQTLYPGVDIRYASLQFLHSPQFIVSGLEAEKRGFDAFAIGTIPDIALRECRGILNIPVVGYGETAMHLACMLGEKFAILNFIDQMRPLLVENARRYGLGDRLSSVDFAGIAFDDVVAGFEEPGPVVERFQEAARAAIKKGADVIIPGEAPLCVLLASAGVNRVDDVPVIDAFSATMKMAEMQAEFWRATGIRPSRANYFSDQPPRARVEELLRFYGLDRLAPAIAGD